jgi:hypothetical protein
MFAHDRTSLVHVDLRRLNLFVDDSLRNRSKQCIELGKVISRRSSQIHWQTNTMLNESRRRTHVECVRVHSTDVFCCRLRMINAEHTFGHHHGLLLCKQCFLIIAHNVVQTCQQTKAHAYLGMHRPVDIIQQIVRLRNQLETFTKKTLLNFLLASRKELIGITRLDKSHVRCRSSIERTTLVLLSAALA